VRNAARTRVDAADSWEPNELGGEVHWLRNDEGERPYYAGLWRVTGPLERFPYEFELNETIHVLEGRVEIAVEEGPTLDLGAGDVASFPAGARAVWRVYETPFRELFVLS
jgi:hypothetical protein